jgi:hypothetical protein
VLEPNAKGFLTASYVQEQYPSDSIYFSATGAGYHWTDVQDAPYYTSWAHFGYPQPLTDLGVNWYWSLGRPVPEGMTYQTVILDTWSNYTQTLVPIPPTALLLGSGLLGLGAVRRFRKG